MKKIYKAERYIDKRIGRVNPCYRLTYHAMPPVGWMNDPNGFSYAFDKIHLFYQFHPYKAAWGPMHWGHLVSEDFIKWKRTPVALAPDTSYDKGGCFSGSAILKDGKIYILYTSVSGKKQTQALAESSDGISFSKLGVVIGSDKLPAGASARDFRDPKVFFKNGGYFAVIGSRSDSDGGQLLLYRSENLRDWRFSGILFNDRRITGTCECPDYFSIDGTDVIIASPQGLAAEGRKYQNLHSSVYMTGKLDESQGKFYKSFEDKIDGGFDFYAPQTMTAPDGRIIMTAWMQMWGRTMPTKAHKWAGAMILPRELSLKNGKLIQRPVREIEAYRKNKLYYENISLDGNLILDGIAGSAVDLEAEFWVGSAKRVGVRIFKGAESHISVYYDAEIGLAVFDRSGMRVEIRGSGNETDALRRYIKPGVIGGVIKMRILTDVSSAEIFFNDGERVMTGNIYADSLDNGIEFFSDGGAAAIVRLTKYDITVF